MLLHLINLIGDPCQVLKFVPGNPGRDLQYILQRKASTNEAQQRTSDNTLMYSVQKTFQGGQY